MKKAAYLTVGALLGLIFGQSGFALLAGIALAFVVYELRNLSRRVAALERDRHIADCSQHQPTSQSEIAAAEHAPRTATIHTDAGAADDAVTAIIDPDQDTAATTVQDSGYRTRSAAPSHAKTEKQKQPNPIVAKLKDWLTTGNVPVKVGVIVSFFGIGFLLKYAVEQNLLNIPMSLRLIFAAIFGLVLLLVGWRLRNRMRVYALSLQGGGVGIIYLTVFAAFRLYGLLPPVPAFVMLALITAPAAALAVMQNARAMAVLAFAGGFLAPILTSTGQGSHIALFSYYLLLNVAIVGMAWFKSWRELNLAGFLFTFVIGTAWGYKYYKPELLVSTEPFLIAHFLLYQLAAILFAFRQPPNLRGIVDGTLIFGTPIVAFGLQAALCADTQYGLAYSAVVLALFYSVISWWLSSRERAMSLLRDSYLALAIAFATVAVPLFLDASWTAATWAMEGAALIWLSVRQPRVLPRIAGVTLIALSGASYLLGGVSNDPKSMAVLNGGVLSGMLISLAGFFSARNLGRVDHHLTQWVAIGLFVWGMGWWLLTGWLEIEDLRRSFEFPARIAFLAISAIALSFVGRRLRWPLARYGSLALLPLLAMFVYNHSLGGTHPFVRYAGVPWLLAAVAHLYILKPLVSQSWPSTAWHFAGMLFTGWLLAREIAWWIVVATWSDAAISLMLTLLAMICLWGGRWLIWPLQSERKAYLSAGGVLLGANLIFISLFSIDSPGDPLPLPYIPLLNPYSLTTLAALLISFFWIGNATKNDDYLYKLKRQLFVVLGAAAFLLSTLAILRGVYHYADLSWRLYSLSESVEVQSALSIYWGLLGFSGMVLGARREWRWLWLTGSGLMALVVAKLFLVDLGNSATVARIVSFIGVGALLLIVGYFAPVPPRQSGSLKNKVE